MPASIEEAGIFDVKPVGDRLRRVPEEDRTEDYPPPEMSSP
jgi:hypothetical protein